MQIKKTHVYIGAAAGIVVLGVGLFVLIRSKKKQVGKATAVELDPSFDLRTRTLLQGLEADFRNKVITLLQTARKQGIDLRLTSGHRDCKAQNKLYAQGRTAPGKIVTNAKCGKSTHNYRRAVDVVEFKNGKPLWTNPNWNKIGKMGVDLGLEWGGNWKSFKDRPHFQDLGGKSIASLYRSYQQTGKLIA